ncbi:hypothetical protein K5E40_03755 [Pseudomonas baetica]|uniref:hypothetical protein n=1 Tax=Pseudomonas baetica TaxID=674054 RepID=UPI001C8C4680|nr:hypothetical protein [Pseudomonas baetica]MBX9404790.1 hypothetical protein [Pseudomonas baetica]
MGHSVKFQAEVLAKDLEAQAEKMLEQASSIREAGQLALADQVLVQHERLLEAIAALRDLNK